MTNDYKGKLLKYLSGNLDKEEKKEIPYYADTTIEEIEDFQDIGNGSVKCTDNNGNLNGKSIEYGYNGYGNYINLYDENGNLLKHITKFSSGVNLWFILKLEVDENGNIYGVFAENNNTGIINARIVLLNNISEKTLNNDYEAIIRSSYFIQTNISLENMNYTECISLVKSKQSASYFMLWYYTGNSIVGQEKMFGIKLNINVGVPNEWTDYTPVVIGIMYPIFIDYTRFNIDDSLQVLTYVSDKTNIYKLTNNDTTLVYNSYSTLPINTTISSTLKLTDNKFYILSHYTNPPEDNPDNEDILHTEIKIYLVENGNYRILLEDSSTVSGLEVIGAPSDYLLMINNTPFYCYYIPHNANNNYNIHYGIIPEISDIPFQFEISDVYDLDTFFVNSTFNVISIISAYEKTAQLGTYYKQTTKIIYNPNNYNGTNYENINSLVSKQGVLYDENNNLIFARNLYNYKVYNNRSISVLNVPNTYLNGVNISNEQLLGDTNTTLISNMKTINKNIYEDLYINFNNQITMQNQNETNYVDNLDGAIRLNQSSGKLLDYDNAKANKIRVIYEDDTSYITSASNSINDGICTYQIGIHVPNDKNVLKIEILSNDENTIYQTINVNLTKGKYYILNQDVHVE